MRGAFEPEILLEVKSAIEMRSDYWKPLEVNRVLSEQHIVKMDGFWVHYRSTRFGESLRGRGQVEGYLGIDDADGKSHVFRHLDVLVQPETKENENGLYISIERGNEYQRRRPLRGAVKFDELKTAKTATISIGFHLPDAKHRFAKGRFTSKISTPSITITRFPEPEGTPPTTPATDQSFSVRKWVAEPHSPLGRIALELTENLERWIAANPKAAAQRNELIEQIREIVTGLRKATTPDATQREVNSKSLDEFTEFVKTQDQDKRSKLNSDYDSTWVHRSASSQFSGGLDPKNTLEVPIDELETIAHNYLRQPALVSPRLEFVLIDALLYSEVIAFARSVPWLPTGTRWDIFKQVIAPTCKIPVFGSGGVIRNVVRSFFGRFT